MKRWEQFINQLSAYDKTNYFEQIANDTMFFPKKSDGEKLVFKHTESHYSDETSFFSGSSVWWVIFLTETEDAIVFQETERVFEQDTSLPDDIALDYIVWLTEEV